MENYSKDLQAKIDVLAAKIKPVQVGSLTFSSPLLLAPMAGITTSPFRLLMENLGAGGTITELISCYGINYGNKKTLDMLKICAKEKVVGIQLFGDDADQMAKAAQIVAGYGCNFVDINMGCPVRKVVGKGAGVALMQNTKVLSTLFKKVRSAINVPLTIKIRTGIDENSKNAHEVVKIAQDEGIEFVTIHGRTKMQLYRGQVDWEYIEQIASDSQIPVIGNGDLHTPLRVKNKLSDTNCQALMLGRGPVRNPFLFLESFRDDEDIAFVATDYLEVILQLKSYMELQLTKNHLMLIQLRKFIVWFSAGFANASSFRGKIFRLQDISEVMKLTEEFFLTLGSAEKKMNVDDAFLTSGHG
ncbi:MAG: tRNA-dihydrouridine synthase family protein [Bacteriovoracaceae bacterium]|nr:tRNA-dihydrouridine synthase family protein [Bacteriovoracaceae bacterium]